MLHVILGDGKCSRMDSFSGYVLHCVLEFLFFNAVLTLAGPCLRAGLFFGINGRRPV